MSAAQSATANFADASMNMLPEPLPTGWKYEWSGGHYRIVPDPKFIPCAESASTRAVPGLTK